MRRGPLNRGFTLIEVQIASGALLLVGAVMMTTLTGVQQFWSRTSATAGLDSDAMVTMTTLRATLREASIIAVQTTDGYSSIQYLVSGKELKDEANPDDFDKFSLSEGQVVFKEERRVRVIEEDDESHTLVITENNGTVLSTLARHVTAFTVLTEEDNSELLQLLPGELQVTLTMVEPRFDQTLTVRSRIWPRNRSGMPIVIEAEDGTLDPPHAPGIAKMVRASDPNASGGAYVWVPEGFGNTFTDPGGDPGFVNFAIEFPRNDIYYLWARTSAPSSSSNSFYILVDGVQVKKWRMDVHSSWRWKDDDLPIELSLRKGMHTITFNRREDGTKLDRILVTDDPGFRPAF